MEPNSPVKILIVDDEVNLARALADTFRDQGYQTTTFHRGHAALEAMGRERFDLLLSDIMMPEMDGITLLRRALDLDSEMVAIMMTGEATITTAVEAMKSGAFDYIMKPFRLSYILPVVSRALSLRRLRLENNALQKRILERTIQLEEANKELEAFTHSVSHDLRAPLRSIAGFSSIITADYSARMPEEARELLSHINGSAMQMTQLIDDLLRFSSFSRQSLVITAVDVGAIVRAVLDTTLKEQGERKVEVCVGEIPGCKGDANLLRQVYVNLISNAFKYSRKKEKPMIEIGCKEQNGEKVYFVRDNGAGFDMKYAAKLFGVFQRLHRASEFEGTGVGLSIVQRIIQRHGGRIWAEAAVGQGAAFYFTLAKPTEDQSRAKPEEVAGQRMEDLTRDSSFVPQGMAS